MKIGIDPGGTKIELMHGDASGVRGPAWLWGQ